MRRILHGPAKPPPPIALCDLVEPDPECDAQGGRWRWLSVERELDSYEQQVHDEAQAEHRRAIAWIDSLTDDELHHLEQQSKANRSGRDLRTELTGYVARVRETGS